MLIHDILPPEKIKKIAKEDILGIRSYKNKKNKYLNICLRFLIVAIIFIEIFSTFSPAEVFGESGFFKNEKSEPPVSNLNVLKIKKKYDQAEIIKQKYKLEKTAFIMDAVDENAIQTEVGNKNLDEFVPELTIRKWEGEVNLKIKYKHNAKKDKQKVDLEGDKIKWKGDKTEVHYYEMKKGEILLGNKLESDVFEVEVILLEKPDVNVVEFDIETKGLNFYYQPALNEEMNDPTCTPTDCQDSHRPENVVGSYAVYHSIKANYIIGQKNYMSGKAFHIYRPKITDSAGTEVWGELNIDTESKLLTVEIPQEFLDNAVYPIRHAAGLTFGYETAGTTGAFLNNDVRSYIAEAPQDGSISKLTAYVDGSAGGDIEGTIYNSDATTLLSSTQLTEVGDALDWYDMNYSTPQDVSASTTYVLAGWMIDIVEFRYDSSVGWTHYYATDPTYPTWPATLTLTSGSKFSIYCTYTAASTYQPCPAGIGISGGGFMMF